MRLVDGEHDATDFVAPIDPKIAVEAVDEVLVGLVEDRLGIYRHFQRRVVRFLDRGAIVALPQREMRRGSVYFWPKGEG